MSSVESRKIHECGFRIITFVTVPCTSTFFVSSYAAAAEWWATTGATPSSTKGRMVVEGGMLGEHKGINLPGVAFSIPALTAKDRKDLEFGLKHGVDAVSMRDIARK